MSTNSNTTNSGVITRRRRSAVGFGSPVKHIGSSQLLAFNEESNDNHVSDTNCSINSNTNTDTQDNNSLDFDEVEAYVNNCKKYNLHIDPGVVITFKTKWHILQPTSTFSEGSILPLMGVLDNNKYISHLKLSSSTAHQRNFAGNGNTNARCLNTILRHNKSIEDLDLSYAGLDDDGLLELCDVLKDNQHITSLNLSSNHFSSRGVEALLAVLQSNQSRMTFDDDGLLQRGQGASILKYLDLSRNALGFESIKLLQCQCQMNATSIIMNTHGNYVFEEILNSVSHGIAFLLSIIAANVMILECSRLHHYTDYHYWATVIYCVMASFMFLCSTLFHSFFMMPESKFINDVYVYIWCVCVYMVCMCIYVYILCTPNLCLILAASLFSRHVASKIFQIFDHIGIYFQIAGSYTPIMLIGMHHSYEARVLLVLVWCLALVGAVFSAFFDVNLPSTNQVEMMIFLGMGAAWLPLLPQVLATLSTECITLLAIGLACYLVGIVFFILGEQRPIYHSVWHVFVFVAAVVHYFAIYFYILPVDISVDAVAAAAATANAFGLEP